MSETTVVWLIVASLPLLGLISAFFVRRELRKDWIQQQRAAALRDLAGQRGWRYFEWVGWLDGRFVGAPFDRGGERTFRHVVTGRHRGREVAAFESGHTNNGVTRYCTVAAVMLPGGVPMFEVRPEGTGSKVADAVGVRDLQLESEEFNRHFRIAGVDDKFAYDVLNPRMMDWLLAHARVRTIPFRFARGDLVVWDEGAIDPARVDLLVDYACGIVERVPDFVWTR